MACRMCYGSNNHHPLVLKDFVDYAIGQSFGMRANTSRFEQHYY